jgi:hypothetical protein
VASAAQVGSPAVPAERRDRALAALEASKRGGAPAELVRLLRALGRARFEDAGSLIRFHEALLFLCAYPPDAAVLREAEPRLAAISAKVKRLDAAGVDLSPFLQGDAAGIAGVPLTMSFGHDTTAWLAASRPRLRDSDLDAWDGGDRLIAALLPSLPLFAEEALVDANVAWRSWLDRARPKGTRELPWLLERFAALPVPPLVRSALWESCGLFTTWTLRDRDSRTRLRAPARERFFHAGTFISRNDVDLARELARPALRFRRVPVREAAALLDVARTALAVRYREIWAFTHGDASACFAASPGRGLSLVIFGIAKERRLPLRAGFGLLLLKNGVPVGYGDVFSLFEKADVSFNVFPTFREGESAWIYAQVLRFYANALGARVFSVDPYQIGKHNDEALDSGAFFFYRRLGFRSTDRALEALARREEEANAQSPGRRSSRRTLARLAAAPLVFENRAPEPGAWDRFHVRNVGARAVPPAVLAAFARAKESRDELETLRDLRADAPLRAAVLSSGRRASGGTGARS